MEAHETYLRLFGLARKGGFLLTGADAVQGAAYAKQARLILVSADASERTRRDAQRWAERGSCLLIALPCDKATLGAALGRGTASVAALTDIGFAAAVAERLAALDSERYGESAERLKLKARRAKERRANRANGTRRIQTKSRPRQADREPQSYRADDNAPSRDTKEKPQSRRGHQAKSLFPPRPRNVTDRNPRPRNVTDRNPRPRNVTDRNPRPRNVAERNPRPRNVAERNPHNVTGAKARRNASEAKSAVRGRPPNRKDKPRPRRPARDE